METRSEMARLWLYGNHEISSKVKYYLILRYGTVEQAMEQSASELEKELVKQFEPAEYQTLLLRKNSNYLDEVYGRLKERNIRILYPGHPLYPEKLTNIYDKPEILFARGKIRESINYYNQSVAIVGARNADTYCKETTRIFARELAKAGIQIVSGLARGIDGQAHRGCLEAGGYTIAVLGCGINVTYPRENIELFAQIEEHGLILSEYCLDVPPLAFQFPLRNRIISGLSDGVLVSCAKKKSGSLITADLALDQGKQVYALPGRVLDAFSEGTNHLIQLGAMCVTRPKDILLDLWGEERLNMDDVSGAASGSAEKQSETRDNLTAAERTVYDLLGLDPVHVDDVIAQARLGVSTTISVLYELERRNVIKQPVRGYYIWSL